VEKLTSLPTSCWVYGCEERPERFYRSKNNIYGFTLGYCKNHNNLAGRPKTRTLRGVNGRGRVVLSVMTS
jgi:hypothetical protein